MELKSSKFPKGNMKEGFPFFETFVARGSSYSMFAQLPISISSFKRKRSNSPCRNLPPVVIQNRSRVEHLILDGNLLTENSLNMPVFPRLKSLSLQRNKVIVYSSIAYSPKVYQSLLIHVLVRCILDSGYAR